MRGLRLHDYADLDAHVERDGGEIGACRFTDGPLARRRARGHGELDCELRSARWTTPAASQGGFCGHDGGGA